MKKKSKEVFPLTEIENLVKHNFPGSDDIRVSLLCENEFNALYRIDGDGELENGLVLKVGPKDKSSSFICERDILHTDYKILQMLEKKKLPVPIPICLDISKEVIPQDYFFMTRLEGETVSHREFNSSKDLKLDLVKLLASFHKLEGDYFGYIKELTKFRFKSWAGAFYAMVTDALNDAYKIKCRLPAAAIGAAIKKNRANLDEVRGPRLVVNNLIAQNVLVGKASERASSEAGDAQSGQKPLETNVPTQTAAHAHQAHVTQVHAAQAHVTQANAAQVRAAQAHVTQANAAQANAAQAHVTQANAAQANAHQAESIPAGQDAETAIPVSAGTDVNTAPEQDAKIETAPVAVKTDIDAAAQKTAEGTHAQPASENDGGSLHAQAVNTDRLHAHYVSGIVDFETVLYGDPLMDFATADFLLEGAENDTDLMTAYEQVRGVKLPTDARARIRVQMYRMFSYVMNAINAKRSNPKHSFFIIAKERKKIKKLLKVLLYKPKSIVDEN